MAHDYSEDIPQAAPVAEMDNDPSVLQKAARMAGRGALRVLFLSGALVAGGSVLSGCYGFVGGWADQSAMKSCAYSGYHGDEPESEFAEACRDAYSTNNNGIADDDGEIYDTEYRGEMDTVMFASLLGVAGGVMGMLGSTTLLDGMARKDQSRAAAERAALPGYSGDPDELGPNEWRPEVD